MSFFRHDLVNFPGTCAAQTAPMMFHQRFQNLFSYIHADGGGANDLQDVRLLPSDGSPSASNTNTDLKAQNERTVKLLKDVLNQFFQLLPTIPASIEEEANYLKEWSNFGRPKGQLTTKHLKHVKAYETKEKKKKKEMKVNIKKSRQLAERFKETPSIDLYLNILEAYPELTQLFEDAVFEEEDGFAIFDKLQDEEDWKNFEIERKEHKVLKVEREKAKAKAAAELEKEKAALEKRLR